ncbi:MAG: zinc ribbon domain-containing protein [Pseudomonas sp.]|uniref:zinc ribbon domain-containing protein n=1 Tax=Pseudomonas sp. TaxID=306 RepID=UPI00299E299B|nr:zinc ribbon domain-containing protein [Pseudomonas sp.]MDX1721540.1 zinc ribbon domain-containing protein [Pseudomonas sp.]
MGLECKACGAPLPNQATTCPACGVDVPPLAPKKTKLLPLAAFMLIVILVIQAYMNKPDTKVVEPAPAAETVEK